MRDFTQNKSTVPAREVSFGPKEYSEVWASLVEEVGEGNYFNGKIATTHADFDSLLTATIIIYRDRHTPEHPITGIVPIWWEMATFESEEEMLGDFSFCEFLELAKRGLTSNV